MKDLLRGVEILAAFELDNASIENGKTFNSQHEGYAVLLEEVQEAKEELDRVERKLNSIWGATRRDEYPEESIQMLNYYAKLAACELIQVVAMSQKYMNSFKG